MEFPNTRINGIDPIAVIVMPLCFCLALMTPSFYRKINRNSGSKLFQFIV